MLRVLSRAGVLVAGLLASLVCASAASANPTTWSWEAEKAPESWELYSLGIGQGSDEPALPSFPGTIDRISASVEPDLVIDDGTTNDEDKNCGFIPTRATGANVPVDAARRFHTTITRQVAANTPRAPSYQSWGPGSAKYTIDGRFSEDGSTVTGTIRVEYHIQWDGGSSGDECSEDGDITLAFTADGENLPAGGLGACLNGFDDDGDHLIDVTAPDPGCASVDDPSELGPWQCDNGIDDDRNGQVDFRPDGTGDSGCDSLTDDLELDEVKLTVRFEGPGSVVGGATSCGAVGSLDSGVCEWWYPRNSTVRLEAQALAPGAYQGWLGCAVHEAVCTVGMVADRTVTVRFDPVRSFAPSAYFSNGGSRDPSYRAETYGAADPDDFFAAASLFWRNAHEPANLPRKLRCPGRQPKLHVRVATAKQLTVKKLMAGKYTYSACFLGRTMKYTSRQLTAPAAAGDRRKRSPGKRGFYLRVPKRIYHGIVPRGAVYHGPPMHYQVLPRQRAIVYWFFFPYNHRRFDTHQGDWEHLAVRLDDRGLIDEVAYYNHLCSADVRRWPEIEHEGASHPVAYIAGGGHGIWPDAGVTRTNANGFRRGSTT